MLRAQRLTGTIAPWVMLGIWSCGGRLSDNAGNPMETARSMPDAATTTPETGTACGRSGTCNPPVCAANEFRCTGATLEVCNAERTGWMTSQVCSGAVYCDAAGGTCKPNCTNVAPLATASSTGGGTTSNKLGPEGMNDGILGCPPAGMGGWHWIDNGTIGGGGASVQYDWAVPQTIAMMHIDTTNEATGCIHGSTNVIVTGRTFQGAIVQAWKGTAWQNIGTISGQSDDFDYVLPGGPVTTTRLRLFDVYSGRIDNTPILEWQVYPSPGCVSPLDP